MRQYHSSLYRLASGAALVALAACGDTTVTNQVNTPPAQLVCDAGNGGITLPPGFCAVVVADLTVGGKPAEARHMAVTPSGDLYVAINNSGTNPAFGIVALRDTNGDGHAD